MTPQCIPVSHLFLRSDARRIDCDAVKRLAASISEIGVLNPLRVRPTKANVNGEPADAFEVTAGAHRLEAAIKAGLAEVPCLVSEDDDLHAELVMIDENLMRAELSPADRAQQTARRKAIYLVLHPETGRGGDRSEQSDNLSVCSFAEATAAAVGKSKRSVMRDAARGESVAEDVLDRIKGTSLDTGAYLDTLKKLSAEEQRARVDRALNKPKPVKVADDPLNDFEAREKQVAGLMAAWNRASPEAREEFLCRIDRPVFDNSRAA